MCKIIMLANTGAFVRGYLRMGTGRQGIEADVRGNLGEIGLQALARMGNQHLRLRSHGSSTGPSPFETRRTEYGDGGPRAPVVEVGLTISTAVVACREVDESEAVGLRGGAGDDEIDNESASDESL